MHWKILIALGLAVLAGAVTDESTRLLGVSLLEAYGFVGQLFLNALKMLVVPLIVASIISAMANLGQGASLGRLGAKTALYYATTSLIAIVIGLTLVNLTEPGVIDGRPAGEILGLEEDAKAVASAVEARSEAGLSDVLLRVIPANVFAAAAEGEMLGLIVFSLLFGFFISRLPDRELRGNLTRFWNGTLEVMMRMTGLVMRFAPIGVFALVAKVVAVAGVDAFRPLAAFFFTVFGALALHVAITLPLLLRLVGGVSPLRHFHAMMPALLMAFSTSSSAATLPVTFRCVEKRAGVSNQTSGFVLPLGATINMDGTALYECVAALFIAQAYGLDLSFTQQFVVVGLALLTSIGVAGIPSASLVAIAVILSVFGLPIEGVGLILAVDRVLDMLRTSVNVFSDSCGAVIIGRSEGEQQILAQPISDMETDLENSPALADAGRS